MAIEGGVESDYRAISPVIGVVIMVAITVVLAAVIGVFVLDLGNDIDKNVQAGANVKGNSDEGTISITYTHKEDAEYLVVSIGANSSWASDSDAVLSSVGDTVTYPTDGSPPLSGDQQVVIVAHRKDQSTVIFDKVITV